MSIPALQSCTCNHYGYQHDWKHGDCLVHHCTCDSFQHPTVAAASSLTRGQAKQRRGALQGRGQAPADTR